MLFFGEFTEAIFLFLTFVSISYYILLYFTQKVKKVEEKKPKIVKGKLGSRYSKMINGIITYEGESEVEKFVEDQNSMLVVAVHEGDCFLYKKDNTIFMVDSGNSIQEKVKNCFQVLEVLICLWKCIQPRESTFQLFFFVTHGDKDHYYNYINLKKICDVIKYGNEDHLVKSFGSFLERALENLFGNEDSIKEVSKKESNLCKNIKKFIRSELGQRIDDWNQGYLPSFFYTDFSKYNKGKEKKDKNENGVVFIQASREGGNVIDVCLTGDNYNFSELLPEKSRIRVLTYPHHGSSYGKKGEKIMNMIRNGDLEVEKCIVTRSKHHSLDPFNVLSNLLDSGVEVFTTYRKGDLKTIKALKWKGVKGLDFKHPDQKQKDEEDFHFDKYYEGQVKVMEERLRKLKEKYWSEEHMELIRKVQTRMNFVDNCMYLSLSSDGVEETEGED